MPLYEYLCPDCGKSFEIIVSSADAQPECRFCGGSNLKRMLPAPAAYSGSSRGGLPGAGDTACCGSAPGQAAGCAGPGSCCGKGPGA